jgi:Family of unknown function (DUF6678)
MNASDKTSLMNNTKWEELRLGMYSLGDLSPYWRTRNTKSGYVSQWDREWFYHFRDGGYETIEWVEMRIDNDAQRVAVATVLKAHHIPVESIETGYKIYGYAADTATIAYIK